MGAITHCRGYCAAAVARATELRTLGIDAELRGPLPQGVIDLVCTEQERRQVAELPGDHWATLLFSAKESIYKAWYPVAQRWLGYLDAELTIDADQDCFSARILVGGAEEVFWSNPVRGRFALSDERVFTAVVVPANRPYR